MNLSTKYELGQTVWIVRKSTFRRLKKCDPCEASGKVQIGSEEFICPKCGGSSAYPQYAGEKWWVDCSSRIGRITVEVYAAGYAPDYEPLSVKYMLEVTGVGSGTIWDEVDLYPTEDEARHACDQHNGLLPQYEDGAVQRPQVFRVNTPHEFAIKATP